MQAVTGARFCELLGRSGLLSAGEIARAVEELKSAKAAGGEPSGAEIADYLVRTGRLTPWQAEQLLQGKYKGFFLKNYKLLTHLGSGGMSNVYVAEHLLMNRRVALKVLPLGRVKDRAYLERFYQEARAAARLDHPNIVRAYDVESEGDIHFLVMEFVPGCDLAALVRKQGPLPYRLAAEYIRQAAVGLAAAHRAGLVHRDIKPANLLVDEKGVVKILDLGLALLSSADEERSSLTLEGGDNVLGTADYIAPEQAMNSHTVDARADIYSLGCSLYFLLTGHPPFDRGSVAQRLLAHIRQQPPSIFDDRPDAPPRLVQICMWMMAKDPDQRPQSAEEVAAALEEWLRQEEASSPPGTAPESSAAKDASGILAKGRDQSGSHATRSAKEQLAPSAVKEGVKSEARLLAPQAGESHAPSAPERPPDRLDSHPAYSSSARILAASDSNLPAGRQGQGPRTSGSSSGRLSRRGSQPRLAAGEASATPAPQKSTPTHPGTGAPSGQPAGHKAGEPVGPPGQSDISIRPQLGQGQSPAPEIPVIVDRPAYRTHHTARPRRKGDNPFAEVPLWIWGIIIGGIVLSLVLLALLLSRS